jgi:hypothetical protein
MGSHGHDVPIPLQPQLQALRAAGEMLAQAPSEVRSVSVVARLPKDHGAIRRLLEAISRLAETDRLEVRVKLDGHHVELRLARLDELAGADALPHAHGA